MKEGDGIKTWNFNLFFIREILQTQCVSKKILMKTVSKNGMKT